MKLTILLLTVAFLNVSADGFSQSVTLSVKNASLEKVLGAIKKQTGYVFLYAEQTLAGAKPVTLSADKMPLTQFLDKLLDDQPLIYTIESRTINIARKPFVPAPAGPAGSGPEPPHQPPPPVLIKGTVTDSAGRPLANVSISLVRKGAFKTYTLTDGKGEFTIDGQKGDHLSFSYVGFQDREMILDEGTTVSIVLKHRNSEMQSAVISVNTGYQRIRPEQSTGAVSQISTREYESQISTDFLSGLANRLPGLVINNDVKFTSTVNGVKTTNSLFNIRGISTMTGNQNPLIVVDGYPTELSLNMINPNEIKSVTILKDAAAATVYGVRASNGVIVIERKQADQGKPQFAFRATTGITPSENYSRYRWAPDGSAIGVNFGRDLFKTSVNAGTWNALFTRNSSPAFPPIFCLMASQAGNVITPYQAEKSFAALSSYNNAKDYGRLLLRTASTQTYNLNISGGNSNALYYITANYTHNRLEQLNNNNNRILLSGRSTLNLSRRLSLELTTDYQEEHANAAPVPDINSLYPYEHLQDADGNPMAVNSGSGINPYYNSVIMGKGLKDNLYYPLVDVYEITDKTHIVNNRITANFNYKIGYGFDLTFGGIYETSHTDQRHFASEKSSETRQYINTYATQAADGSIIFNIPKGGFLQQQAASTSSYTVRAQLNYNKHIGRDHSLNGILGAEMRDVTDQGSSVAYFGYDDQTLLQQPVNFYGIANHTIPAGTFAGTRPINYAGLFNQQYMDNRYLSGFSHIVYAFRNTYSLSGSMRIDQSNLFGTNPKYKYKPLWSVGAAWNVHKENFMKGADWIKQLKLRTAYGFNGNVAKMSLPQVIAQSYLNSYTYPASTALQLYSYANRSLRWEQTNSFNAAIDYSIFRGITGSIDYYTKRSTDLLASAYIDPTIGVSPSFINTASINNQGLEISLHADWISRGRFNWNTGLVLSRNTSKVLKVYQNLTFWPSALNGAGYLQGYPVGALFAYRWAGLDTSGSPQVTNQKGSTYSINANSNIMGDSLGIIRYMGPSTPTINAGLSNRIDIGDFYFYCMINYYGGFKVQVPRPDPSVKRALAGAGNYWKQRGDEKNTDVMSVAAALQGYPSYVYSYADRYIVNGDYITLGDITASYSFNNSKFFKRAGLTHFEIKLQASNVYTVGLNKYNFSQATGSYAKSYLTPTYTIGLFTNF